MIAYPPLVSKKGIPTLSQNRQFQWFSNPSYFYPIVLAFAATLLKNNNYEVIWKDGIAESMTQEQFYTFFEEKKPDLIAIETKTPVVKQHWKIIDKLKEISPKTKVVLMGDHVTALPKESLENSKADYILTGGDYDFLLLDLCNSISKNKKLPKGIWYKEKNKIKTTGKFQLNHNLDNLPIIDRELTKWRLYQKEYNIPVRPFMYIMSGRDCPWHKCKFCAWTTLFPKFRVRSVKNVLDEIGFLIKKYKIKEIFDDTGTFPGGKWLEDFCKEIIKRGYNQKITFSCNMRVDYITESSASLMKKANFRLLKVGLESANQETLDKIDKNIKVEQITNACRLGKKYGLTIHLTMIVGYPWETKQDALRTFNLAKKLMTSGLADVLQSTILVPYPGTPLWKEALKNNWFNFDPKEYERYDMSEPVLKTIDMSPSEVKEICNKIYKIFISPKYVLRHISKIRTVNDVLYTIRGFKAIFGHLRDFAIKK